MPIAYCTRLSRKRGGPMPRRLRGPPSRTKFDALCDDVVLRIFTMLPSRQRANVLPLVCHRFARLMDDSVIDEVQLDTTKWGTGASGNVIPWLQKRLLQLRCVELVEQQRPVLPGGCECIVPRCPGGAAIISAVLGILSAAPRLESLSVNLESVDVHSLTALQACKSLQSLSVGVLRGCMSTYHIEVVLRRLTALTALKLEVGPGLHHHGGVGGGNFPAGFRCCRLPPSLFCLTSLRQICVRADMHMINFGDLPAELGNLRSLRSLELLGCGVDSIPQEVTRLQALTTLAIENCECQQVVAQEVWFKSDSMPQLAQNGGARLWPRFTGGLFPFINWLNF